MILHKNYKSQGAEKLYISYIYYFCVAYFKLPVFIQEDLWFLSLKENIKYVLGVTISWDCQKQIWETYCKLFSPAHLMYAGLLISP
jgi:hypothetical protein